VAIDEEELLRPRAPGGVRRELKTLSVDELQAYAAELRAEASRVEAEIVRRREVRGAADALFRKPPPSPAAG
jgi:uncharacterized small protein (DUF1192 family)